MASGWWAPVGLVLAGVGYVDAGYVAGKGEWGYSFYAIGAGLLSAALGSRRLVSAVGSPSAPIGFLVASAAAWNVVRVDLRDGAGDVFWAHLFVGLACTGGLVFAGVAWWRDAPPTAPLNQVAWTLLLGVLGGLWYAFVEISQSFYDYQLADWLIIAGFGAAAWGLRPRRRAVGAAPRRTLSS